MTHVFFVRHAECDHTVSDDRARPLTGKGRRDCALVTGYLADKNISFIASSPYRRALDTVGDFAQSAALPIACVEEFRERRVADVWVEDFKAYTRRQWADFDHRIPGGESLREVQTRNISALNRILDSHPGENITIASHGTALATILNYYDKSFGFDGFWRIIDLTPWIVHMEFEGNVCVRIIPVDLFGRT